MDPFEALEQTQPRQKQDKLTKALASMGDVEAQEWLDIIDGKIVDAAGNQYSANHIERAMRHVGHNVSVSSIKARRNRTKGPETR